MLPFCFWQDRVNGMGGTYHRKLRPMLKSWVMNWLDIVLIGLVIIGALRGFRIGLLGAAVNAFALVAGWLFASQVAYALGLIGGNLGWGGANLIVAVYVITIALTVAVVQFAWRIIRKSLGMATLGASSLIDRVGGLLLGVILGAALAVVLVLALARLTYDIPFESTGMPGASGNVRNGLERALTESVLVRTIIEETEGLPLNGFGLITPGFAESLEMLGRST